MPTSVLWFFRVVASIGLATMFVGPKGLHGYGASAFLAASGAGALAMTAGTWRGTELALGGGGTWLTRLLLVTIGLGLLGAAYAVAVADCRLP
jgi:hypothetical protein